VFDIASGQTIQVGQHNDTVKCAKFLEQGNILATASWDKTLKYWDLRSPQPVGTVQLPERCYTMDSKGSLLVLGLAERQISVIDLNQPQNIAKVN
jgi:mRNA export factor